MRKLRVIFAFLSLVFIFTLQVSAQEPDSDQDGVPDSQDRCPAAYAPGTASGCPDTDGDGVDDGSDQCPNEAYFTPNGCQPDADGDGVPDVNDQCPGSPGTSLNNGCPEGGQAEPTQTTVPAPQIQLPTTGACVITPAGGQPVNVRADRSTDAAVLAQIQPGLLYFPNALIDGWYGLPDPAGWVRVDVVLTGGDCSGLDDQPANIPITDFTPDFANCGEISQQVSRVPITLLMQYLNSADPCGGLTTYLRDRAFNPPLPPSPGAQALSGSLQPQCSSDSRPYPSPEALRYLSALQAVDEELAANVAAQVAASIGAAPGSDGDRFICALMRGDGFVVGAMIRRNTNEMGAYWTAMCAPPIETSYISRIYNAQGFDPLPGTATDGIPGFIPPEAALIIALTDQNHVLAVRTQLWCSAFSATPPTQAETTPERQAIIDWLIGCGFFDQALAAQLIHALNSGGIQAGEDSLLPGLSLTWETLETIYAANGNGQNCPTALEILSGVPRFRVPSSLPDTINLPAPTFFVGQIYLVQPCDEQNAVIPSDTAPAGCFAQPVYRFSSSGSGGTRRPVGVSLPDDPFGTSGQNALGSLSAEITHYVLKPNFVKDPFETGLAGVSVQVYTGFCTSSSGLTTASGGLLRTVTTDANGVFSIDGLTEGQNYCALVDAASGENSGIFGGGSWWWSPVIPSDARITADTRTAPTTIGINFTAPPAGNIQPVRPYGWLRGGSSHVQELLISTEFNFDGLFRDLLPNADALDGDLTTQITVTVFNDLCNPDGWDGTPENAPPFCVTFPGFPDGYGISADGGIDRSSENGIEGIWVAIYEGSCLSGSSPIAVAQTDTWGNVILSVSPTRLDQTYCAIVDASLEANAAILGRGGWTTVSGSRIYYSFSPRIGRVHTALFPWWQRAEDVISAPPSEFDLPSRIVPIGGDAPTATPEGSDGTEVTTYLVTFNMIVFDDQCDASGWDGNFRWLPEGCATWEPATLRANGTREPEEPGIPGVTIDILNGTCTEGTPGGTMTTNAEGRITAADAIPFLPGEYCFVIDPAQHGNAAALQPGMWSATGTQVIRIPQPIDRDLNLTTTIGWWRTAPGSGVITRIEDIPAAGIAPEVPLLPALCPPGSSCEDIPPRVEPIPDVTTLFPEIDPAALERLAGAVEMFGGRFGNTNGVGILIGRSAPDAPGNLFLYEGGNLFDIGAHSGAEEAPSVSPTGILIGYISRDQNGVGTLMIQNLDNGIFFPAFRDIPGMRLISRSPLWSADGRTLLITLADENGTPSLYQLSLADLNAPPVLVLADADDPAITGDGALMAFVRGGNVFIRFNATGAERQITQNPEGAVCDTPLFDPAGVNLYFNCRQGDSVTMFKQGFDGLETITPEGGANLARFGVFVDGVSIFSDGQSLYFGADDATHLIPLVQIDGVQVTGIRWAG